MDYVIHFCKPKKGLLLSRFYWHKYLVAIKKILHDSIPRVIDSTWFFLINFERAQFPRIS